jgi:hypothetical protein
LVVSATVVDCGCDSHSLVDGRWVGICAGDGNILNVETGRGKSKKGAECGNVGELHDERNGKDNYKDLVFEVKGIMERSAEEKDLTIVTRK